MNKPTDTTAPTGAPERPSSIFEALNELQARLNEAHAIVDLTWDLAREGFDYDYAGDLATTTARRATQFCRVLSMSEELLSNLDVRLESIIKAASAADRAGGL